MGSGGDGAKSWILSDEAYAAAGADDARKAGISDLGDFTSFSRTLGQNPDYSDPVLVGAYKRKKDGDQLVQDEKDQLDQQKQTAAANAARDEGRTQATAQARGASGYRQTILTSPLGVTSDYRGQLKTVLGG